MKRDYNFIQDDDNSEEEFEFYPDFDMGDGDVNNEEEDCPYLGIITALALQDKPFGFLWPKDKMTEFLKARGYKILDRKNKDTNEEYSIAVSSNSSSIPDEGRSNIKEAFDSEMQDIILKWVLRIAKENDSTK